MRMYSIFSPATVAAADRHYARHHHPVMAAYREHNLHQSPDHQDKDSPSGSFGQVHFRILDSGALVAVKEPFANREAMMCFLNEVRMVEMLPRSINVVRTLGLLYKCFVGPPSALVMTMYPAGTFHSFMCSGGKSYSGSYTSAEVGALQSGSGSLQSFGYVKLLTHLLAGIANGLAHLHACGIIHNDLSESNVFVDHPSPDKSSFALPEAVVGDLGRSTQEEACGEIMYKCAWLAKRTIHETRLSAASDIFSLGTIMLSALGGTHHDVHSTMELGLVEPCEFITNDMRLSPNLLQHIISELRCIIRNCTDRLPANRPSAIRVRDQLRKIMNINMPQVC